MGVHMGSSAILAQLSVYKIILNTLYILLKQVHNVLVSYENISEISDEM